MTEFPLGDYVFVLIFSLISGCSFSLSMIFLLLLSFSHSLIYVFCSIKVHPSSISIEGALGNLRLCDMSLGTDHCWGWLCDIRNPGVESLIKVSCYHLLSS